MKVTKKKLLSFVPEFHNDFESAEDVLSNFSEYHWGDEPDECAFNLKDITILYADYTDENYNGDAYVFGYNKVKKSFFEVYGSHCSCYGLEGQWTEDYLTVEELIAVKSKWLDVFYEGGVYYSRSASQSKELHNWWTTNLSA